MTSLIVAVDKNYGIAKSGGIPWKCPDDMKLFKRLTTGIYEKNIVVMGRRTWETLKAPLSGRTNIIISRTLTADSLPPGCVIYRSPQEFLSCVHDGHIWIIGGYDIYMWFINNTPIREVFMSQLPGDWNCDLFLPLRDYFDFDEPLAFETFTLYCSNRRK